ncbi:hypothetical protein RS84_02821 [Microbacterium hydrocarbonoxydans]|uniref:GH16 domain-containing protein n=1 Tax=Microbacterium hydrocarbonoxydans TaxID=273678 RepID=A0A0M2HP03_9MICO|nr:hypothetical protein [Microbacterium hydrocarbonoxydans]KJL46197.1 hypothetical protein RS84_02821 [Microbacterium hydrocarbonoxydans]
MLEPHDRLPDPPRTDPVFDDDFSRDVDPARWIAHYLPHWSVPERSAARYSTRPEGLELRIDEDQLDWRPEDAPLRVSNLQTGVFAGPLGSARGTHRHRPDGLVVRTETPTRVMFAPERGRIDLTVSASTDRACMLAAWLVGTEHSSPDDSSEICVFEIDADAVGESSRARSGIKAHHDRRLRTDMAEVVLPFDASRPHTWTVIWGEGKTIIGCEGRVLRRLAQAPDYPMILLIDLFEIGPAGGTYPKTATIHRVRAWDH